MDEPKGTRQLLRLFPHQWRSRYGDEFAALLAQTGLSFGVVFDVLLAAVDAHLHPTDPLRRWPLMIQQLRRSELTIFVCWVILAVAGSGFAKLTEGAPLGPLFNGPIMRVAYDAVVIAAIAALIGVLAAGVPIAFAIAVDGYRRRRWSQIVLLIVPVAAALGWIGVTLLITRIDFPLTDESLNYVMLTVWLATGVLAVVVSCVALGVAALNSEVGAGPYRRAIYPARLTVAGMVGVATAIAFWGIALLVGEPYDFWGYSGLLATSTALSWFLIVVAAGCASLIALRAARELGARANLDWSQ